MSNIIGAVRTFLTTQRNQPMIYVIIMITVFAIVYYYLLHQEVEKIIPYQKPKVMIHWRNISILLIGAFLVKLYFAVRYEGHAADMSCFYVWADDIYNNKFNYYNVGDPDYPPGYMMILWLVSAIRHIFSIDMMSLTSRGLTKTAPILFDLGAGFMLYRMAKEKFSENGSLVVSAAYMLCPTVILDSSIWGQVDSVYTFFVFLTGYLFMQKKRIPAYFVFMAGILMKPQTVMFGPIIIWVIIEQVFMEEFKKTPGQIPWKFLLRELAGGLGSFAFFFLCIAPFGVGTVLKQYTETVSSFEYGSVNAFNFWALMGKNWAPQADRFGFLTCQQWGTAAIVAAVFLSGFVFFRLRKKGDMSRYFVSMAVLISTVFLFAVRMHERYLFPVLLLTMASFVVTPKRELFFTNVIFAGVNYLNVAIILSETNIFDGRIGFTGLCTIAIYAYFYYAMFKNEPEAAPQVETARMKRIQKKKQQKNRANVKKKFFAIHASEKMPPYTRTDFYVLGGIMLLYSLFTFHDIGDMHAPENGWVSPGNGTAIVLDMGKMVHVDMLYGYLGTYETRSYQLDLSADGTNYESVGQVVANDVFKWDRMSVKDVDSDSYNLLNDYRYVRLTVLDDDSQMMELVIKNPDGEMLEPVNASDYPGLFDEQDEYRDILKNRNGIDTFREGTYFDEIYHARTGYEITQGLRHYEWTHPPLGKIFISIGISIFGMNPFGWRIIGILFGIGMLPFIYVFGRRLFGGQIWAAGVLTGLFAFDFMHFAQTRIATIDVYGTFFIIAMYYFMYRYYQMNFYDTDLKKTFIPLGLSAVMMGLGCSSKWTAVYAAAGLGLFFFSIMLSRFMEYRIAKKNPHGATEGISHAHIIEVFPKYFIITIGFCIVFFVGVAGLIYLCSYIPFSNGDDSMGLWARMIQNQKDMFNYHSGLEATHPYSSVWYEWPIMKRPVFYYCKTVLNDMREGISGFGNPLVWWAGIPAFVYMVYRSIRHRDKVSIFLVFAFLVQLLPWTLVERCTFAYHYFPSVPFVTMMVAYIMVLLVQRDKRWMKWAFVYAGAAFLLFCLFYPVLSGQGVPEPFVRDGLRWLTGWQLII